jgi:hypothetical protein
MMLHRKSQKEGLTATLIKPGDFPDWEHEFLLQVDLLGLQQHLKRKIFLEEEPAFPDIRRRKYTKTTAAQRTIRSETPETEGTNSEDIQETTNGTWSLSDLTEQGQKSFQQDLSFYQLQEKSSERQRKSLRTLQDWIIRTVSPSYIRTCCQPRKSIYEWHYNLRARCGRSEADETRDARNTYLTLMKTPPKTATQALKWLEEWEEALAKGQQQKVPETLFCSSWAYDFLNVSSHLLPAWTAAYEISQQNLIQDESLIYRDLANAFRNKLKNAEALRGPGRTGNFSQGAFSASFAGEDPQDDEPEDARIIEGQYRSLKKEGQRTKRQRPPEEQDKCPACGLPHVLKKCFYVFPNIAWRGFRPREKFQTKVKEALEEDLDLQAQVKALTQKKSKISPKQAIEDTSDQ